MKVMATFTGQDGSLGYRNGKSYTLDFSMRSSFIRKRWVTLIHIHVQGNPFAGECEYNSLRLFLDNWEVL